MSETFILCVSFYSSLSNNSVLAYSILFSLMCSHNNERKDKNDLRLSVPQNDGRGEQYLTVLPEAPFGQDHKSPRIAANDYEQNCRERGHATGSSFQPARSRVKRTPVPVDLLP